MTYGDEMAGQGKSSVELYAVRAWKYSSPDFLFLRAYRPRHSDQPGQVYIRTGEDHLHIVPTVRLLLMHTAECMHSSEVEVTVFDSIYTCSAWLTLRRLFGLLSSPCSKALEISPLPGMILTNFLFLLQFTDHTYRGDVLVSLFFFFFFSSCGVSRNGSNSS